MACKAPQQALKADQCRTSDHRAQASNLQKESLLLKIREKALEHELSSVLGATLLAEPDLASDQSTMGQCDPPDFDQALHHGLGKSAA